MTDREKMIEVVRRAANACLPSNTEEFHLRMFVTHLLANGVILPPCKVGDDVYLIPLYGGKPYCGIVKDKVQMIGITSRGFHIKARSHKDHNKTHMLGSTAFLTHEEAEEALREKENG